MATPEEILAKFGSATRAEAEKGINNPHSDGGKKNADADAAEPVADAIHPDEEKENRTAQLQERNDPLAGETKKFLTKFLQLNNIQLSIIEGDGVLNSFFTRLGLADFTDKDTLIRGLRVLKPRYHPDRNGGGDDEKIKILNGASSWIKKSYESYHPNVSAQELSPEELLRREKAVWDAKTFEDLFAVVTSFGAVYSESFQRDVPVEEWIRRMERDRQDASSFNTRSEFFYSGWSATVTRTHGIREKFVALVSQMIDENERVFMERKTTGEKEREILVNSAKTPEELCDIVASFETIHSQTLGNTSGKKWAEGMREELASALLYEDEDDLQMYWYSTATRTYGIREKFEALVLEKVRYEKSKQKARKDAKQRIKNPNSSAEDPPLKQRRASNRSKKSAVKEPVVPPVASVNATELQKEKTQPTREELVGVKDFDELFAVLEKYDGIQGSGEFYTSERLRDIISNVRKGDRSLDPITNSKGLRGVVKRLLQEEREPYVSGEVFNQEILAEQDARSEKKTHDPGKENIMTPGSPDAVVTTDLSEEKKMAEEMGKGKDWMAETAEAERLRKEKQEWKDKIKKLEGELDELRAKYVKKDYEETSVWKRISRVLGRNLEPSSDIDEKAKYQEKLQELLDARLTLAKLGKEGDALKDAMAGELRYFMTESKIKLYDARTEVKGTGYFEKVGNYYNDLVRKHPWVSAGIGLTLLGASFASGGAAPATLTLAVFLKRAIATPGLFVTTDSLLGKASAYFRDKSIKEDVEKEKQKTPEEMEEFIKAMNANCDKALLKCKVAGRIQKSIAALAAGLLFGHTAIAAYEHFTSAGITEPVKVAGAAVKGATDTAQVGAEDAPAESALPKGKGWTLGDVKQDAPLTPNAPAASAYAQPSPGHFDSPSGVAAEAAKNAIGVPSGVGDNIYEVSKGDTVDGLIGSYLSEHYQNFDGMTDGQKTDAINALERQLKHLSPEQLKLAGIGSGNIHSIQVEELVDLDKLFSAEDADKVMGKAANISAAAQHSIEQNNVKIAEWVKTHPGEPYLGQSLEATPPHAAPASHVMNTRGTLQLPPSSGAGVPPDYIPDASDAAMDQAKQEISKLQNNVASAQESINALAMQPRVDGWIKPMLESVPERSPVSSISMADMKKIPLKDIQYAMTHDSADAYERVHMTREQFANVKQFIQGAEKDRLVPPLNDIVGRKPDLKIGDYITKIALDPKVKVGYMVGGRGGFSTSI